MIIVTAIMLLIEGLIITVGWNSFIVTVSGLDTITFFQGVAAAMLKVSLTRGFGLRITRESD